MLGGFYGERWRPPPGRDGVPRRAQFGFRSASKTCNYCKSRCNCRSDYRGASRQPARVNKAVPASLPATPVNFNRECFICYGTAFNRPPSAPLLLLTLLYAGYRLFLVSPLPSCPCRFYSRDNKDRFRLFRPSFTYAHSLWSREFNRGVIC